MLSKTYVKEALLVIPPAAATHPDPPPCVCRPPSSCRHTAFVWVVVALP